MLTLTKKAAIVRYEIAQAERHNYAVVEEFDTTEAAEDHLPSYEENALNNAGYEILTRREDGKVLTYAGDLFHAEDREAETLREEILEALRLEANEVLVGSGDHSQGFWHNEIEIDLEELQSGNMEGAFSVVKDIHDTAGTSFRQYYGIDIAVELPDGVTASAIAALCEGIWERREELTAGFSVEWINGNNKAVWDGETEGAEDAQQYWADAFPGEVQELDCMQVYDLADSENVPFVMEGIAHLIEDKTTADKASVLAAIEEVYARENDEVKFTNYDEAAEEIVERYANED